MREVDASELRSPYGAHCLIFVSDAAGRRVWDFPTDRRELSDDALEKLSWGR